MLGTKAGYRDQGCAARDLFLAFVVPSAASLRRGGPFPGAIYLAGDEPAGLLPLPAHGFLSWGFESFPLDTEGWSHSYQPTFGGGLTG